MEIPTVAVDKFKGWAKFPERSSIVHDKRFVQALIYIITKSDSAKPNDVELDDAMMFIRSIYTDF